MSPPREGYPLREKLSPINFMLATAADFAWRPQPKVSQMFPPRNKTIPRPVKTKRLLQFMLPTAAATTYASSRMKDSPPPLKFTVVTVCCS